MGAVRTLHFEFLINLLPRVLFCSVLFSGRRDDRDRLGSIDDVGKSYFPLRTNDG